MRVLRILIIVLMLLAMPAVGFARPGAGAWPVAAGREPVASPADGDSLATLRGRIGREAPGAGRGKDYTVGIPGAVVQLFYQNNGKIDSLYTTTGRGGDFTFRKIKPQRIGLRISSMGYQTVSGVYDIAAGDNAFFFTLKEQVDTLACATITAEIPLIKQIQDTTIYNTKVIKAADEDNLRQVLEMLPGFVVSGDAISVDGHPVTRTYVNGILVFGDKVTTAIDALKANEVSQVKVYDELSDIDKHRGVKNAKKNRVLDIITKDAILSMTLASAGAAGGADRTSQPRYAAAGLLGFHSEMFQSQTIVSADNINKWSKYSGLPLDASSYITQKAPLDAYSESLLVNLRNIKYWKNRYYGNSLSLEYTLNHVYSRSASTALTEYYGTADDPAMTVLDTLSNSSTATFHNARLFLSLKDTPLKSFDISINGSLANDTKDDFQGNLTQATGISESKIHQESSAKGRDYSLKAGIKWTNNDAKKWRPLAELGGGFSRNNSISWYVDTLSTSYLRRKLSSDGYGNCTDIWAAAGTEATLANDKEKTAHIILAVRSAYNHSLHRQLTFDEFGVETPVMDMANSYDFTHNQLNNSVQAMFDLSTQSGTTVNLITSLIDVVLFDRERLPADFNNTKHFPSASCDLRLTAPRWLITASSSAQTPAIEQIRNRVSDTNPLSLVAGNPHLKQGYTINLNATYRPATRQTGPGRNSNFSASLGGNITLRPVVTKIQYFSETTQLTDYDGYTARAGSILNTFDNARQPRINLSAKATYDKMIARYGLKYIVTLSENYLRSPIYYGGSMSPLDESATNFSLQINYKPSSKLSIVNIASTAYLNSYRSRELLSSRFRTSEVFKIRWYISDRIRLISDYSCTWYAYTAGTGRNHFSQFLNAGIETPLLKDKSLTIGLWGYDLLNSGSLYTTEINSAMMSQTWTPTYGRNILLKVVYSFRKKQ